MMNDHAPYAPSSMHITAQCAGWIKNASLLPPVPRTEEQMEGDAAHWVALNMAMTGDCTAGVTAPNGIEVTDEMIDGAYLYLEAIEGKPGVGESTVTIPRIHPTKCWGSPDWWQWTADTKTLKVVDYKFGFKFVEVWENWQLISYAAGLMDFLGLSDDDVILELVIVQPRSYHRDGPIRTWRCSGTKIRAQINILANQVEEADTSPNPATKSGDHCLQCVARVGCTTYQKSIGAILDFTGVAEPLLQTPGDIGRELRLVQDARERLKGRQTGLEAMAEQMIRTGQAVPFFGMEQSAGRLRWLEGVSVGEVEGMIQALVPGKTALKPATLVTPTQTRALLPKAAKGVIDGYAERAPGAMKLVRDNMAKLSRIFQK
jgi:Protein of unknown function (DUF2800)